MEKLFKTEEEAITWVGMNIPIAIKPKNKAKTTLEVPFTSTYAHEQVVEHLGEQLFKYQQQTIQNK
jgi:hypothetical protein